MIVWPILGGMTLLALVLLLVPMLWRRETSAPRASHEIEVYKAQLGELERDVERGVIGEAEAEAARLEVQRRLLAADAAREAPGRPLGANAHLTVTVVLLIGLPLVAGLTYAVLGRPDLSDRPVIARTAEPAQAAGGPSGESLPSVESMVEDLEGQLEETPDDPQNWFRLGRAYGLIGRHQEAADAFRRAIALDQDVATLHASLGEALTMAASGTVTGSARAAFNRALELDPSDPRARFYTGLAESQRGEQRLALDTWSSLWADSPPDAPWLPSLRAQGEALALELDEQPDDLFPAKPEVAGAPPGEVDLASLEAALEADPKDWQGWIRLAQGYAAAGDGDRARASLDRGREAYAGAPFVLQQFDAAAADLGLAGIEPAGPTDEQVAAIQALPKDEQDATIRGMVEGLAARLESEPDDLEGWLMLGRSWRVLGEDDAAIAAFERAAALMPAGSSERAEVEAVIEDLRQGG
jgi:cytochrome c-type biogenesis protein CcmH